jgi:hypothetical protein
MAQGSITARASSFESADAGGAPVLAYLMAVALAC